MPQDQIRFRNPVKSVGFAQIEHAITMDDRISDGAYRLFALYIMFAQQKDSCYPGRERLAKMLKCSETTISRRNTELETCGYITRQKRLGTSSMTYIEDVEDIPYLKQLAEQELSSRTKNDTSMVSNMQPQSYQKCYVNNNKVKEQDKEEQELRPTDAESIDSDSNESGVDTPKEEPIIDKSRLDNRGVLVQEFVDNELIEFTCCCGVTLDVRHLRKTRLKCPTCETPIEIRDSHGRTTHKPLLAKKRNRVLGDIIPDCPTKLQDIMYYANQKKQIKLLLTQNSGMLFDALNWAINKFIAGNMAENKIVTSALTWAGKRNDLSQKTETKGAPKTIKAEIIEPSWMDL